MMLEYLRPKSKTDLVRVIQQMRISKIEIVDGYVAANEHELLQAANDMSAGLGDVTIIMVRS